MMHKLEASLPLGDVKDMATQIRENVDAGCILARLSVR